VASYVVMRPPGTGGSAGRAELVRDRFTWLGFLFPPLWLIWHTLWIEALLTLAALVVLTALGGAVGFGQLSAGLSLLVSVYVGLEGPALRLAALRRRNWQEVGVVDAGSRQEAEIRLFAAAEPVSELPAPQAGVAAAARQVRQGPALGLLDYPGR